MWMLGIWSWSSEEQQPVILSAVPSLQHAVHYFCLNKIFQSQKKVARCLPRENAPPINLRIIYLSIIIIINSLTIIYLSSISITIYIYFYLYISICLHFMMSTDRCNGKHKYLFVYIKSARLGPKRTQTHWLQCHYMWASYSSFFWNTQCYRQREDKGCLWKKGKTDKGTTTLKNLEMTIWIMSLSLLSHAVIKHFII